MTLPTDMKALLLVGDGYAKAASAAALEAMEPYVQAGRIGVPEPGPTQALIKVGLASINPSDISFIKGQYGQPRVRGRPAGFEGVGIVTATGDDPHAKDLAGKRVAFATGLSNWGSWAQYAVAEAASCIPLLDTVRDEDGAAMVVNPLTALAMFDIVRQEGAKSFVMTAGASQLCKLIIGLAKEEGFRPIVTVRRDDQVALLKGLGAAHVLNEKAPDFEAALREAIRAEQPRIFLDAVTGPLASTIFNAMPKHARWIIYGRLDAEPTVIREPGQLIFQHKHVEGFWLAEWMRSHRDRLGAAVLEAQKRFSDGRWSTDVTAVVALDEAMARLPAELAKPNGKVFLRP